MTDKIETNDSTDRRADSTPIGQRTRASGRSSRPWLAGVLVLAAAGASACGAEPVDANHEDEEGFSTPDDDKLLQGVNTAGLWKTSTVTYCFPTPSLSEMPSSVRSVVRDQTTLVTRWRSRIQEYVWAINQTWQSAGVLNLKWQEACGSGMVRVSYSTNTPTGGFAALGQSGGLSDGVHMDSEFLGDVYTTGFNNYHTFTAAHEFGHILGFEHEQDRTDSTCHDSQDFSGAGIRLTTYDPNSIMNYCNAQHTALTALDRAGFAKAYAFLGGGGTNGSNGGTTGGTSCRDSNTNCSMWARSGECTKNPGYMLTSCCASCSSTGGTTGGGNTGTGTTGGTTCRDSNTSCSLWARNGECTKNPGYMLTNCCTSCNTGGTCRDTNSNCSVWAASGECTKNPGYMLTNCCASCR